MKPPILPVVALLTLAGCGGLRGPDNRIGSDYANVRLAGSGGFNGRSVPLVKINPLDVTRADGRTTVVANNDGGSLPAPPIRAMTLIYEGPEVTFTGEPTPIAPGGSVVLTYADYETPPKVWRAVGGSVTLTGDGRRPGARLTRVRLEPDASILGNAARGVLTVTGFLNPSAPQ